MQEMTQAVEAFGGTIEWLETEVGDVCVVTGPKGQVSCLVTERGFSVKEWADSLQARVM